MYFLLLSVHSIFRWMIMAMLIYTLSSAYIGWKKKSIFSSRHILLINYLSFIACTQVLVGLLLYLHSPIPTSFRLGWPDSIHNRSLRFFAIEHSSSMLIALAFLITGKFWIRPPLSNLQKFKIMGVYCAVAILIIILATPWQFSPFVSRPHFRIP